MKRRRVFRAVVSYAVFAFAVLQIVEPILHAYHWGDGVLTWVVTALAAGFPATVALAWLYDLRRGSVERTRDAPGGSAPLHGARLAAALIGIGALCAAPGLLWYLVLRPRVAQGPAISAAVLPFENLSGDPESEAFSDGITEELMNALAQFPRLRVAARMSCFTFKGKRAALSEVGEKLGVTHVVEGSVRRAAGRVRVTARLEEVASGAQVWSGTYEEALSDVFGVQANVARAIASALRLPEGAGTRPGTTTNVEAYELYLKGRYDWAARPVRVAQAIEAYEAALRVDPRFALAWAGLAEAYATLGSWENGGLAPSIAFPKAKENAQRALEIDAALAEAHNVLAYVLAHYDRAWEASEREFQTALRLRPDLPGIHHWHSHLLLATGHRNESLRESLRTKELDPLDPVHNVHLAWHYFFSQDFKSAQAFAAELAQRDPRQFWFPWFVSLAELQSGRAAEAVRALELPVVKDKPFTFLDSQLALSLAAAGRADEVAAIERKLLEKSKAAYVPAYDLALVRLALGNTTAALRGLDDAVDERSAWAIYMAVDPRLQPLRARPEFSATLARAGLSGVPVPVAASR